MSPEQELVHLRAEAESRREQLASLGVQIAAAREAKEAALRIAGRAQARAELADGLLRRVLPVLSGASQRAVRDAIATHLDIAGAAETPAIGRLAADYDARRRAHHPAAPPETIDAFNARPHLHAHTCPGPCAPCAVANRPVVVCDDGSTLPAKEIE